MRGASLASCGVHYSSGGEGSFGDREGSGNGSRRRKGRYTPEEAVSLLPEPMLAKMKQRFVENVQNRLVIGRAYLSLLQHASTGTPCFMHPTRVQAPPCEPYMVMTRVQASPCERAFTGAHTGACAHTLQVRGVCL